VPVAEPATRDALNNPRAAKSLVSLLDDRRFLARVDTRLSCLPFGYPKTRASNASSRPLSRQTVSALKGRESRGAAAANAEGLEVTPHPYMIETCADETWRARALPTPRERLRW